MAALTAEEIAELRRAQATNEMSAREYRDALPRLLDELEELRKHLAAVSGPRWREDMEALARARALLKRIEWKGNANRGDGDEDNSICPECGGDEPTKREPHYLATSVGHEPGCELAALLGAQ